MIKICVICKNQFKTSHKELRCCSRYCSGKQRSLSYTGKNNPNWKGGQFDKKCSICRVDFIAKDCRTKLCSNCRILSGKRNPNWNGGKELVKANCLCCKKSFEVKRKEVRQGRKYCSSVCSNIIKNKTNKKKNTKIENTIETWLKEQKILYKAQVPVCGITLADFVAGNNVIFCDGDYWHSLEGRKEKDMKQTEKLMQLGFNVHRLTETEIKNGQRPVLL